MSRAKELFKEITDTMFRWCESSCQRSLQQQAQVLANNQQQYLYGVQIAIQSELFQILYGAHHEFLVPVHFPKNVRLHSCYPHKKSYVFCYSLSATSIPSITHLSRLKDNINTDIYQYRQSLLWDWGFEAAMFNHPYIVSGMSVVNIHPYGTELIIEVMTNYYP